MASLSLRNTVIPAGDGSNPAIFKKLRSEEYQEELELYSETLSKNNDDVKKNSVKPNCSHLSVGHKWGVP